LIWRLGVSNGTLWACELLCFHRQTLCRWYHHGPMCSCCYCLPSTP
jgi:hypothetical protein